ncbi:MAG: response regulator [Bacteroidales bacterium]|nr:response regulator [Bacteroidales bacterium]
MKSPVIKYFLLFCLLLKVVTMGAQPHGKLLITNYSQRELGSGSGQFWAVTKDHRGVLYVAGEGNIFEFDGNSWRAIPIPNQSAVRSLAVDSKGVIYVGAVGEIGYLKANAKGKMEYVSMLSKVPRNKLLFSDVWSTNTIGDAVYFQTDNRLFRYQDDKIKVWNLEKSYHRSFAIEEEIYLNQQGIGLCKLDGDSLKLLPNGGFFSENVISSIIPYRGNYLLIGTRKKGLFLYNMKDPGPSGIRPFHSEANDFIISNLLYHGINLTDNKMAFSTLTNGTIITDFDGKILKYINKSTGFIDYTTYYLNLLDNDELWITSSRGVGFYNINSPVSYWNDELGLKGIVNAIIRDRDYLYVGTHTGLFYQNLKEFNSRNRATRDIASSFGLYENLNMEVWDIIKFNPTGNPNDKANEQILAGTGLGLYDINKKKTVYPNIRNGQVTICQSVKNPSILYFNTHPTFYILQYHKGVWHKVWEKNISSYILSIVEDANGDVWIGTRYYGIFRLNLKDFFQMKPRDYTQKLSEEDFNSITMDHFNTLSGLPNLNECMVFMYLNQLVVSCQGLYGFNEEKQQFEKSEIFGEEIKSWNKTPNDLKPDVYGNIWGLESEVLDKQPDGTFKISRLPYQMLCSRNATLAYYHDEEGSTWIGGEQGLFQYDSRQVRPSKKKNFQVLIRKVSIDRDSLLFFGTNFRYENEYPYTALKQPAQLIPELSVQNKSIIFEFASPYFQDDASPEYSFYLEGYDENWSDWSNTRKKEYNNLRENTYTFHVRARNTAGEVSEESSYTFIINPPWYRTILAYIAYILLVILTFYTAIKLNSKRLRRYNLVLEKTVKERTQQLEDQKEEINNQAMVLQTQNEKLVHQKNRLAEMSKEIMETNKNKLRFFTNISHELRTPLTLILGPVEELLGSSGKMPEKDRKNLYTIIHRNASRLLTLINQILDFRKMEIGNQKLSATQGDIVEFVESIAAYFNDIAHKKNIDFIFSSRLKEITTWYDQDKIEKILFNLLSNAFKYTGDDGKISISIDLTESHKLENFKGKAVSIAVRDNGIGIEEENTHKIFDRFFQSGQSISLAAAGSGIGLSMASTLAALHHGKIELESKINAGSTFTLLIPYGKDYLKDDEVKKEAPKQEAPRFIESKMAEFKYLNTSKGKSAKEFAADPNKKTVLLVEDSEDIRSFIMQSLHDDFNFIEAENGVEGIEMATEHMPDLIITDVMMPKMDGFEFCSKIKTTLETSHIPVIVLTSKSNATDQKAGLEKGADDFISKPFNINILKARMQNLIKSRDDLRERFQKELVIKPTEVVLGSTDEKFIHKAIKLVEENMSNPAYDIDTFSRDMAMSQSTLYRKLKALTGQSTNNFIKDLRLNRAATLLAQNEISVSEIATMVGFDDPAYFSKSFKQKHKLSPSEYSKKKG